MDAHFQSWEDTIIEQTFHAFPFIEHFKKKKECLLLPETSTYMFCIYSADYFFKCSAVSLIKGPMSQQNQNKTVNYCS